MGTASIDENQKTCTIRAAFIFYGDAATEELANKTAADMQHYWNDQDALVRINGHDMRVCFDIAGHFQPGIAPEEIWYNDDPVKNFFRIEAYTHPDVSFVDGIGSNTGYFKLANLLQTGTTAAHEFGHTLGLDHPHNMDIRGYGIPGIMYPRGMITDPQYLYNPLAIPGDNTNGGTMNPAYRKVSVADIQALRLHRLSFRKNAAVVIGGFSSIWHEKQEPDTHPGLWV